MTASRRTLRRLAMLVCAVLATASSAYAVDGVILINQNRALAGNVTPGDAPGFPVSIDLNGFAIRGPHTGGTRACQGITPGKGIGTGSLNSNAVEIRNGSIERMGCDGIFLLGFDNLVENVRVRNNGATGVQITGIIRNSTISLNGREGISSFDAVVTGNHIIDNEAEGIVIFGGVVTDNHVERNGDEGLFVPGSGGNPGTTVAYSNNSFDRNDSDGVQVFGGVQTGPNLCVIVLAGALCP